MSFYSECHISLHKNNILLSMFFLQYYYIIKEEMKLEAKQLDMLDSEWIDLMVVALDLGLNPQEIQLFLQTAAQ